MSYYLGKRKNSKFHICVYCRNEKNKVKGDRVTRCEARHFKQNLQLKDLYSPESVEQSFGEVKFYDLRAMSSDETMDYWFVEICKLKGLKSVLASLDKSERRSLRKEIAPYLKENIKMVDIKKSWKKNIHYLRVLEPDYDMSGKTAVKALAKFKELYC